MSDSSALAERGGVLITMHSLSQGGGDRIAVTLASGFARAGIPTRIALMSDAGEGEEALKCLLHPDVVVAVRGRALAGPVSRVRERVRGIRFIRGQIHAMRPAVVLAATDNMALVTALATGTHKSKPLFVQKLTNRLFRPNLGPFRRVYRTNLFKFILARIDLVITLTEGECMDLLAHYPEMGQRVRTLPNPHLSDDMFHPAERRSPGSPRLLTAGRMVPQKRYDLLLRALAMSSHKDARLTIFGDGPLRSELEALARSLGIADRVDMPGFVPDIIPAVRQSDLVVLSSDYEGLPGVLIRALACNVPVVTTDSFFAAHELFDGAQSCAVVPTGDAASLADAIDRCLDAPRPSDLQRMVEPYRIETAIDAYIAALGDLAERSRRAQV
jgi:glycosyltransferase involved in cell wall biosynthesis